MTERDELAELGRLVLGKTAPEAAKSVLAAGYRRPKHVTTAEDLDALPAGTVVLDEDCEPYFKGHDGSWLGVGYDNYNSSHQLATYYGPLAVVGMPDQPKEAENND